MVGMGILLMVMVEGIMEEDILDEDIMVEDIDLQTDQIDQTVLIDQDLQTL